MKNEAKQNEDTVEPLVRRGYRVAQAMTAEGLQAVVNNLLTAGFEPVGGVSVTLIGTMHEEPLVLHTQALFYTSNAPADRAVIADTAKPIVGCTHDWRESIDTQFCNEHCTEVKCTKCGMYGEKTIATGEVFFPAT